MKNIEVKVLNPEVFQQTEQTAVFAARLTQRGNKIKSMNDLFELYNRGYGNELLEELSVLPHDTIQRFSTINIAVVGASRRLLAQLTRHQVGVTFMSGSLQYSDYSGVAQFVVPYEMTEYDICHPGIHVTASYLTACKTDLEEYEAYAKLVGNDAAGYKMPQGMRNILLIGANAVSWKHMISQRTCRRNTLETQYVMLRCWEALLSYSSLFEQCGPSCLIDNKCKEGKMSCGHLFQDYDVVTYKQLHGCSIPQAAMATSFKYIMEGQQ